MILALALIHHLSISNNIPFNYVAEYFSKLSQWLIIEFVPKTDKKVQKLLLCREDVFSFYNKENFVSSFSKYFSIHDEIRIKDSGRTLFLMKKT